jgi:hypothetical protein
MIKITMLCGRHLPAGVELTSSLTSPAEFNKHQGIEVSSFTNFRVIIFITIIQAYRWQLAASRARLYPSRSLQGCT